MGGECYKYIQGRNKSNVTAVEQKAYENILPQLHACFEEWKCKQDALLWDFTHTEDQAFCARFTGKNADLFQSLRMPKELAFEHQKWRVGWQHRSYGSYQDPAFDLAGDLIALLQWADGLRQILKVVEEDCIAEDLGVYAADWDNDRRYLSDPNPEEPDYTACSSSDCGYCGRCGY